jgi:hypothetical protein
MDAGEPLPRTELQVVAPDAWTELRFRFHPSLRRMPSAWNTVSVWQAVNRDEEPAQPELAPAPVPWLPEEEVPLRAAMLAAPDATVTY